MDHQVKVVFISAFAAILIAVFFNPIVNYIDHHLVNKESIPVLISFEPDKASPQMPDVQINWTATANNSRNKPLIYRFNLKGPSTNYTWEIVQTWGMQNWWCWKPTKTGDYIIQVQVSYGKSNEIPDSKNMNYTIFPSSETWTFEGFTLYNIGKYDEARNAFGKAIAINSQDSGAWVGKGSTLRKLNQLDEAMKAYNKALEVNSHNILAFKNKESAL